MASTAISAGDFPKGWMQNLPVSVGQNYNYVDNSNNLFVVNNGETGMEWMSPDPELIVTPEEIKIRKENAFVRELYEQYKVALILASGDE